MLFDEIRAGGCCSYLLVCEATCSGVLVDPELSQIDRFLALLAKAASALHYVLDTHTHADHFSAARELGRQLGVPVVMHRRSAAPVRRPARRRRRDAHRRQAAHARARTRPATPRTRCAWSCRIACSPATRCCVGGTGRTDLPTGDPEALYESLFGKLLRLDDALLVFPGARLQGARQ